MFKLLERIVLEVSEVFADMVLLNGEVVTVDANESVEKTSIRYF